MNARAPASFALSPQWGGWHRHFAGRTDRPLPATNPPPLGPALQAPLARSLAIFQLGESGEGRIAHQVDRCTLPFIDADYRSALKLFVAEEGRHARILGRMVRSMGGECLQKTWTEALFRHGRRLMGVRLKLLVLLAAEVIAVVFYGAFVTGLPASGLRDALTEIISDEEHHLAFHVAFFLAATPTWAHRLAFKTTWWAVASAACAVVAWDHRATLAALGAHPVDLARRCIAQTHRVAGRVTRQEQSFPGAAPKAIERRGGGADPG